MREDSSSCRPIFSLLNVEKTMALREHITCSWQLYAANEDRLGTRVHINQIGASLSGATGTSVFDRRVSPTFAILTEEISILALYFPVFRLGHDMCLRHYLHSLNGVGRLWSDRMVIIRGSEEWSHKPKCGVLVLWLCELQIENRITHAGTGEVFLLPETNEVWRCRPFPRMANKVKNHSSCANY